MTPNGSSPHIDRRNQARNTQSSEIALDDADPDGLIHDRQRPSRDDQMATSEAQEKRPTLLVRPEREPVASDPETGKEATDSSMTRAATWRTIGLRSGTTVRAYLRHPGNARYITLLAISVVALVMSLLDFGLISGAVQVPAPGLQAQGTVGLKDASTYGFEFDTDGWQARGAARSAVWNNSHVFAGQGALEVQVAGLTAAQKAFVYVTVPPNAKPGSLVTAHLYIPSGATPLVATVYALDGKWAWSSGAYPSLNPGTWTALTYAIPKGLQGPIREMGIMLVGVSSGQAYTGPIFLDAVNIQS